MNALVRERVRRIVRSSDLRIAAGLLLLVAAVYGRTTGHGFVGFDDPLYLFSYPEVQQGVSPRTIAWAFGTTKISNWHPVTWIAHTLDWQLYGGWAGGHHLTSVVLHATSTVLLFLTLARLSGARWPSAFVAAVFAVHPTHVESVAWIAELKDALSGFFWMIALYAYARFVESRSAASYAVLLSAHAFGLMSKPMGVTLPLLLLLLDVWPLGRLRGWDARAPGRPLLPARPLRALVVEKLPLLALTAASVWITLRVQHPQDLRTLGEIPLVARVGNAAVGYAWYVAKTLWPSDLAVLYLHPVEWPLHVVAMSLLALAAVTLFAVGAFRRHPYLLVGWLWFLGTLVPAIGIVQVGYHSFADRYTYLPTIGLSIFAAWGVPASTRRWRHAARALPAVAAAAIAGLALTAHQQVRVWRDTETLWRRVIAVAPDNHVAHENLGSWLVSAGRVQEGLEHARRATRLAPDDAHAHYNLGALLWRAGELAAGERSLRRALEIDPTHVEARINLAIVLDSAGRSDAAQAELEAVLAAAPDHAFALAGLGYVHERRGDPREALLYYRRALAASATQPLALRHAARILATARDPALRDAEEAVRLAVRACPPDRCSDVRDLETLASAYALAGRRGEALAVAERAARLARRNGQPNLADAIARRAARYASGGAWAD